jgi:drug/metabolite transporter (DMT)-like permease
VSTTIAEAPMFTLQAVRYALAAVLLLGLARAVGRPLPRPRGGDWVWLIAVAGLGLVLFNIGIVRGVEHAEPAVIGVAVAAVPLLLAVIGPLVTGHRPAPTLLAGAAVVTTGAVLVQGTGDTDAAGIGYAMLVLLSEAGFTLCAIPVLTRLGAWALSFHAAWIAAAGLAVLGLGFEGAAAVTLLDVGDLLAVLHLAVIATALAFVLWYTAVGHIGASRSGLFTGVVPVTAAAGGVLLGGPPPSLGVWAGTAVVAGGIVLGLRSDRDTDPA